MEVVIRLQGNSGTQVIFCVNEGLLNRSKNKCHIQRQSV